MNAPYLRVTGGTPLLLLVLPYLDGYIRADLSADRTARAGAVVVPDDIEVSLTVDLLSDPDLFLWARDSAECAPLTTFFVNFDFRHHT